MWTLVQAWARLSITKGNWRNREKQIGSWSFSRTDLPLPHQNSQSEDASFILWASTHASRKYLLPDSTDLACALNLATLDAQSRMCHVELYMWRECILPWWFMYETINLLSVLMTTWQSWISGRKWVKTRIVTIIWSQFICHVNDHPSGSVDWETIENCIPTFWQHQL